MECILCGQKIGSSGCLFKILEYKGRKYKRIKFGESVRFPINGHKKCPDCQVEVGQYHHFGCDWEECPRCGGQLLTCKCKFDKIYA